MCRKSGQVVERFEKGNFAHDEECYRQYIAALVETGQQSKVMPEILGRLERERGKITNAAVSATKIERAHIWNLGLGDAMNAAQHSAAAAAANDANATQKNPVYVVVEEGK